MMHMCYWDILRWLIMAFTLLLPIFWFVSMTFRYYVKVAFLYFIIGALPIPVIPMCLLRPYGDNFWIFKCCMQKCPYLFGIQWEVRGKEKLANIQGPCIIICNHQSALDIMGMMEVWPPYCVPMMKKALKYAGFFGIGGNLAGAVFIDRFNKEKAIETCNKTVAYLRRYNLKLWVYPEGTRGPEGTVLPFKKGAFHLSVKGQLPIVPVVISRYSHFYSKKQKIFHHGGHVIIEILDPIKTDNLTNKHVKELAEQVRQQMIEVYERISKEAVSIYNHEHGANK